MKLKNKISGEIKEFALFDGNELQGGVTLEILTKEWEDYEEPKEYWIIDTILHEIRSLPYKNNEEDKRYEQWLEELGLKFESKEEAEKAVEKLKAWKRLKDKGFRFIDHIDRDSGQGITRYEWDGYVHGEDLDLLFSQEDD